MENEKPKISGFKKLINWISTSFLNKDGKVCSKRTSVFALIFLSAYIIIFKLSNINAIAALSILVGGALTILVGKDHFETKEAIKKIDNIGSNNKKEEDLP